VAASGTADGAEAGGAVAPTTPQRAALATLHAARCDNSPTSGASRKRPRDDDGSGGGGTGDGSGSGDDGGGGGSGDGSGGGGTGDGSGSGDDGGGGGSGSGDDGGGNGTTTAAATGRKAHFPHFGGVFPHFLSANKYQNVSCQISRSGSDRDTW